MEDNQIVALFWDRDQRAVEETAAKYGNYCFSIARSILDDPKDAEEAVNDSYMGLWNAIPPHRPQQLSTFLGKITRRIAIKKWKARRTAKRGSGEMELALEELAGCIPSDRNVEKELEMAELGRLLNRFILALPEAERRVFLLRYWYLAPIADISIQTGCSQSKIKSMLWRTRNKLRITLEKEGIDL